VIALTANALAADRDRCIAAGADSYLIKPVDFAGLFAEIRRLAPQASPPPARGPVSAAFTSKLQVLKERYRERLPKRVDAIQRAWEQRDVATIVDLAHQLAGSAGTYGFQGVGDAARTLELRVAGVGAGQTLDLSGELGVLARELAACTAKDP
jgi:hypothetical protein